MGLGDEGDDGRDEDDEKRKGIPCDVERPKRKVVTGRKDADQLAIDEEPFQCHPCKRTEEDEVQEHTRHRAPYLVFSKTEKKSSWWLHSASLFESLSQRSLESSPMI